IVIHLHSPDFIVQKLNQYPRYKLPDYWIGRMERACIWMADAVLSPSRFLAAEIQKHLEGKREDIEVIPYPHGQLENLPDGKITQPDTFLYVGRIELRKGVEELLRTCDRMWAGGASFRLELAGGDVHTPLRGGSLRKYLESRYKRHVDSGKLVFHGNIDYARCMELMQPARAVLVPSLWENFPNVCMEAMLRGKLVVASNNGGQAEMLGTDGEAGVLFSHAESGSLQTALEKAMLLDESRVAEMGHEASVRIVRLCDPARILKQRLFHFRNIIDHHQSRAVFPFSNRSLRDGPLAEALPESPLVTVVVPYYNLGKYLKECVDSILASQDVEFEVLIVNDGSTDPGSIEALDTLRKQGLPNIRILDIPNGGLANARNTGAKAARGELVAFVDADDAIEPGFLSRAVSIFRRYANVHLAYSWVRYFDGGKGVWHSWTFDLPYLLCHNQLIPIVVVRRESFLRHGQNKAHIVYGLEDYEGWWSMAEAGCGGVAIPEALVRYRIRGDSMFRVIEPDKKLYLYDLISAEHPGLMARYGLELFNLQNANGPAYGWDQPTMFRAPQDRLMNRAAREEAKRIELEQENRKLKEAEEWFKKTFKEHLND
ncbi:MAG TPA: glycosyltransferase, partial [Oceanipulchritudo sp.]|nr:glycosyltransferase [Oceanipulchritudo sp.]